MKTFSFPAKARLKSKVAIDALFNPQLARQRGMARNDALHYPLRCVWMESQKRTDDYRGIKLLVSVPKRKLKRGVDRVVVRRRIKEAWRLSRPSMKEPCCDVAFIYVADKVLPYAKIYAAVTKFIPILSSFSYTKDKTDDR